jgi:hypothetical protein
MIQTAIEYYSNKIGKLISDLMTGKITGKQFVMLEIKLLDTAKEMEKEQIKNAYNDGHTDGVEQKPGLTSGTIYYNETYGGNK